MWPVTGASKPKLSFECPRGHGCCVSAKHRVIVVSSMADHKLFVFDLDSGQLLRTLGLGKGSKPGQLHFTYGGVCFGPSGDTVMVAEYYKGRVSELALADGAYVTNHGPLSFPEWVDCDPVAKCLLVTSFHAVTVFHIRTKRNQVIAKTARRRGWMTPARCCGDGQSVLVHFEDEDFSSHIRRMSLSGDTLESLRIPSVPVIYEVVPQFDTHIGTRETLIVAGRNSFVGPVKAVQSEDRSTCWWHGCRVPNHLVPMRDGSGTLVIRKRNSVHVLQNPERDLRWAWIAAAAVAFVRF